MSIKDDLWAIGIVCGLGAVVVGLAVGVIYGIVTVVKWAWGA